MVVFGHRHPYTQQKAVSNGLTHRLKNHLSETHSVLESASILVSAMIGRGGPELVNQMTRGNDLESVEAAGFAALCGGREVFDDAMDVLFIHCPGESTMQNLSSRRGRHDRYPFACIGVGPPSEMSDLSHQERIMLMIKI